MTRPEPFRVLIVGGGVVGLTLANALEQAGVDFLVLEKGEIAPHVGASISVLCHTSKIFEQLGIWGTVSNATIPLTDRQHFDEHGRLFDDSAVLRYIHHLTKRPFIFMERRFYLETLYGNIKDKSKVRPHVGVLSFEQDDHAIKATLDDGTTVHGDILVGADGIHSTIRQQMADDISKSDPQRFGHLIQGFTATYRTIFGTSTNHFHGDVNKPFLSDGMVHNVYYRNVSGISTAGVKGLVFWFLFVKEASSSTTPHCPRYTDADAQATMDAYGHMAVGPGYTFMDLWDSRVKAVMAPMEEGVIQGSWNNGGRVVLIGDATSKSTINPGLGGNTAVEGVCNLVNELLPILEESQHPSTQEITGVFNRYEAKQRPRADLCVSLSGYVTRFEAMDTWWLRLLRLISPWIPDSFKARFFLDFMAPAPVLNFLPDPGSTRTS